MPGWTLPGVVTTGAAQSLLRSHQVSPGQRVLVSGNGPLNLQVAAQLVCSGVTVVALAEVGRPSRPRHVGTGARMLAASPELVAEGLRYRAVLARARVPVLEQSAVIRMDGDDSVRSATVAKLDECGHQIPGTLREFQVDSVCVGFGFSPSNEIARSLGCKHLYEEASGSLVLQCDEVGRTSVDGVWVVGDGARVAGAKVARERGALAGLDVVSHLGKTISGSGRGVRRAAQRAVRRNERFQSGLQRMYMAPILVDQLADAGTIVCRCETVSMGRILGITDTGTDDAGTMKRLSRAGMGSCQGRYCGPVLMALGSRHSGHALGEYSGFAPQIPYRPVEIGLVAAADEYE